jgi:hypothetical protein
VGRASAILEDTNLTLVMTTWDWYLYSCPGHIFVSYEEQTPHEQPSQLHKK